VSRRHVVQEVEVIAETPVGEPRSTDDYSVLDSVPGEAPARAEPRWDTVAEMTLDGQTLDRFRR
jgi:hypothetical protein